MIVSRNGRFVRLHASNVIANSGNNTVNGLANVIRSDFVSGRGRTGNCNTADIPLI